MRSISEILMIVLIFEPRRGNLKLRNELAYEKGKYLDNNQFDIGICLTSTKNFKKARNLEGNQINK